MGKEKAKHDWLLCFLLALIAVLILVIGGGIYYFLVVDNGDKILNAETENINTSTDLNQEKNDLNKKDNLYELEAKKILEEYIKLEHYQENLIGPMPYILVDLGLETEDNINLLVSGINDTTTDIKTNTKYEDFKEALLQYVTENYFVQNFSHYKNIDGYVGVCNCGASRILLEVEDITLSSVKENQYIFDVLFKDLEVYEHYLNPEAGENINENDYLYKDKISFEKVNNKLVISEWK